MSAETVKTIDFSYYDGPNSDLMALNEGVATKFMRIAEMQSDIVVLSRDIPPKKNGAMRRIDFNKAGGKYFLHLNPKATTQYRAQSKKTDQSLDETSIRTTSREIKNGIKRILAHEKLFYGLDDFSTDYLECLGASAVTTGVFLPSSIYSFINSDISNAVLPLMLTGMINGGLNLTRSSQPRTGIGYAAPPLPIDLWLRGRLYLARHGKELIVPKSSQPLL